MDTNKPSNTLAIIGLVLGVIAILFSFIPCVGTLAFVPGIIGLIIGVVALLKARDNGHPQGLAIGVIVVSVIACAISAFQIFALGNMASDMKSEMKEYTNCEELKVDYEKAKEEMATLTKEMEDDNASFSSISKMTKLGVRMGNIRGQGEKLECDIDFDDFDPSEMNTSEEAAEEGAGEAEGEGESIEEEQGN